MKKILAAIIAFVISVGTVSGVYAAEEIAEESLISEIMEAETAVIPESELQEEIIPSEETEYQTDNQEEVSEEESGITAEDAPEETYEESREEAEETAEYEQQEEMPQAEEESEAAEVPEEISESPGFPEEESETEDTPEDPAEDEQEDDIDPHFTGFAFKDEVWGYYTDGVLQTSLTSVIKGTVDGEKAWWYVHNGIVTFIDTVADNSNGRWCIRNGRVDFEYTGFAANDDGEWYCVKGKVKPDTEGLFKGTIRGEKTWWYVYNGKVTYTNTVAKNSYGWWFVRNGKV
ncbi:MAG: hypothetical protein HUJ76_10030, partial [Parasporobacterium sp.]|nr:hypothetical protein [Parasporobacterium sp.]